ncbi:PH-like domain-containing protein [Leucobacter sp. GX24907]
MNRPVFAILVIAVAIIVFIMMWLAWRGRARRDADVAVLRVPLSGEVLESLPRAGYVSTTPEGQPLVRVAAPGLSYRGNAELTVRTDGVTIQVTGEGPVSIEAAQVRGRGTTNMRIGKAVESHGLSLLRWESNGKPLESSFRFGTPEQQTRFEEAIDRMLGNANTGTGPTQTPPPASGAPTQTETIQEDS